jgi:hypothetical protein
MGATKLRARMHASRQSARTATRAPNCWAASVTANRVSRSVSDRATGSSALRRSCSTACARASSDRSRQASIGPSAVSAPGSPAAASSAWALASRTAACSKTAVPGWRAVSVEWCVVEVIGRSWPARAATTMRSRLQQPPATARAVDRATPRPRRQMEPCGRPSAPPSPWADGGGRAMLDACPSRSSPPSTRFART